MKQKKQKNDNYFGYHFFSNLLKIAGKVYFGAKITGKENIPKNGGFILAGNHVSNFDCYLIFLSTKREVHILGKKELFESKMAWFFKAMHIIPVDRKNKNPEAVNLAINYLKDDKVVLIFPEGTYHKKDILLPFKPGVIKFSLESDKPIIPFAIKGKFKFRSKPEIIFGKPIYAKDIIDEDKVKYLENIVKSMLL